MRKYLLEGRYKCSRNQYKMNGILEYYNLQKITPVEMKTLKRSFFIEKNKNSS